MMSQKNSFIIFLQVDGKWSEWIDSKPCSEACGNYLIQRKRYCNDPSPSEGGRECWGLSDDFQFCNKSTICPGLLT